uniref:Uncharacterized protein n=1 Tax=Arundo donax TaxID=35708 RepID=A0A0A9F0Z5_ARUDO
MPDHSGGQMKSILEQSSSIFACPC